MLEPLKQYLEDNTELMDVEIAYILDNIAQYPVTTTNPYLLAEKLQAVAGIRDYEIISRQDLLDPKYQDFQNRVTLPLLEYAEHKITSK